jgi:RNA polymerase sigma-70 factor, ECF subfamily
MSMRREGGVRNRRHSALFLQRSQEEDMHLAHVGAPDAGSAPATDDDALAARAVEDREAFAELYVRHRDMVIGYLRARTRADDDALELTAVTFERALVAIHRYRPRGAGFRAWLLRIARNAAIDEGRRRNRTANGLDGHLAIDAAPRPDEMAEVMDEQRRLRLAIAALPEPQGDALGLRFGAGLTAREIGAVIDKGESATQKLIERAIDRLREVLA